MQKYVPQRQSIPCQNLDSFSKCSLFLEIQGKYITQLPGLNFILTVWGQEETDGNETLDKPPGAGRAHTRCSGDSASSSCIVLLSEVGQHSLICTSTVFRSPVRTFPFLPQEICTKNNLALVSWSFLCVQRYTHISVCPSGAQWPVGQLVKGTQLNSQYCARPVEHTAEQGRAGRAALSCQVTPASSAPRFLAGRRHGRRWVITLPAQGWMPKSPGAPVQPWGQQGHSSPWTPTSAPHRGSECGQTENPTRERSQPAEIPSADRDGTGRLAKLMRATFSCASVAEASHAAFPDWFLWSAQLMNGSNSYAQTQASLFRSPLSLDWHNSFS